MKRFLFSIVLMGLMVLFMEPAGNLLSNFLRLDQPRTHQIAEGDWLSKVAQKYYGDTSYWRELALINRAPDGDLIFPGEEIIVPSFEAIREVRTSRRLSAVNDIVEMQQDILAGRMEVEREPLAEMEEPEKGPEPITKSAPPEESQDEETAATDLREFYADESSADTPFYRSTLFITGMVILAVVLAIGLFMFVRQKKREKEEISYYGSDDEQDDTEERSIFRFGEDKNADNGSSKKRQKQEKEEVVH